MRRTQLKRNLFSVVLLVLYFLLAIAMFRTASEVGRSYQTVSLRYDVLITYTEANNARQYSLQNPGEALFWPTYWSEGQTKLKSNGADIGQANSIFLTVMQLWFAKKKCWQERGRRSLTAMGVRLSGKLAWRLWGSTNGVGQVINIDGRDYVARGVFESDDEKVAVGFGSRETPTGGRRRNWLASLKAGQKPKPRDMCGRRACPRRKPCWMPLRFRCLRIFLLFFQ